MSLDGFRKINTASVSDKDDQIKGFFSKAEELEQARGMEIEPEIKREPEIDLNVIMRWRGPEFEVYEKDGRWMMYLGLILIAIIGYAVIINSPVMAILFILIGVVGYLYMHKEPRELDFIITDEGVIAGNEIYEFDGMKSFWIFYNPPHEKILSLHTKSHFVPFVHIPLHDEDPVAVRRVLIEYMREVKQKHGAIDALERFLRI